MMDRLSCAAFLFLSCVAVSAFAADSAKWSVKDGSGNVCILASFNGNLNISYNATNASTNETFVHNTSLVIPSNAGVNTDKSFCFAGTVGRYQRLVVTWPSAAPSVAAPFNLSITFVPSGNGSSVDTVTFQYDLRDGSTFPEATPTANSLQTALLQGVSFVVIPGGMYLRCMHGGDVTLTNGQFVTNVSVVEVELEAFRMSNTTTFDDAPSTCQADMTTPMPSTSTPVTSTPSTPMPTTPMPTTESTTMTPGTKWSVNNGTTVCILAQMTANFTISYNATNAKTKQTYVRNASLSLPLEAKVNREQSFCVAGTTRNVQRMALQWGRGRSLYNVTLTLERDEGNVTTLRQVALQYDLSDGEVFVEATPTNASLQTALVGGRLATVEGAGYLRCLTGFSFVMSTENVLGGNFSTVVGVENVLLQAFRASNSTDFEGNAEVCPGDQGTTTPMTPTSPATPTPAPSYPTYNVTKDGRTCLLAKFDLSVVVTYSQVNEKNETVDATAHIDKVNNGTLNEEMSSCNETEGVLVVDDFLPKWRAVFAFTQNAGKFLLSRVEVMFNLRNSSSVLNATHPDGQTTKTMGLTKWQATLGHAYQCAKNDEVALNLTGLVGVKELKLVFDDILVQPFVANSTQTWGVAEVCASSTSDVVPIAVGCALAALVVIVLIAYVIGRRRNRARGYESM